jgi:hypothetical protein
LAAFGSGDAPRFWIADFGVNGWVAAVDFGVSGLIAGDEGGPLLKLCRFWADAIPTKVATVTKNIRPLHFIILDLRLGCSPRILCLLDNGFIQEAA